MTEETRNAAMSGSIGIIMAIGVSTVIGWIFIIGLLFAIQDLDTTIHSPTGQPVIQIFLDTVGSKGAIVLVVIVTGCMYFCGWVVAFTTSCDHTANGLSHLSLFSVTANSRMIYAFARDGGVPGHKFFYKADPKTGSPTRTVWLACTLAFILGLPSLGSSVAFTAVTRYEMGFCNLHHPLTATWLHVASQLSGCTSRMEFQLSSESGTARTSREDPSISENSLTQLQSLPCCGYASSRSSLSFRKSTLSIHRHSTTRSSPSASLYCTRSHSGSFPPGSGSRGRSTM